MTTHKGKLEYIPWPEDDDPFEREPLAPVHSGSLTQRGPKEEARSPAPALPSLPYLSDLSEPQRYLALCCSGLLLLLLLWLSSGGSSSEDSTFSTQPLPPLPSSSLLPSAAAAPAAPVQHQQQQQQAPPAPSVSSRPLPVVAAASPSPPPPPGMGPGGPVVGSWGLSDAVLPGSLTFLAIGDWGRGGTGGQEVTAPPLAAWAAATGSAFLVSVGDNVYVDGVPPGSTPAQVDALMRQYFSDVYTQPELAQLPVYAIMGNHDYRGALEPQLQWRGDARWRPGLNYTRRWRLPGGGRGTSQPRACLAAVFTDTSPLIAHYSSGAYADEHPVLQANARARSGAALAAWTRAATARAAAACDAVLVFGHHPLYSPGEHANSAELIGQYGSALEALGVDAWIAGHDHLLGHSRAVGGGVEHVLTGAGSEVRPETHPGAETQWVATVRGFTVHSINATHAAHSYVWCDDEGLGATDGLPGRIAYHVLKPLRAKARG